MSLVIIQVLDVQHLRVTPHCFGRRKGYRLGTEALDGAT